MDLSPVTRGSKLALRDADAAHPPSLKNGDKLARKTEAELERFARLQDTLYADGRHALLVVLQGRDASGKDGTVRTVFGACNPMGCEVTSFKEPTALELRHDFLWRVHQRVPALGMVGIFNRSHYEDVLVARVHDLVPRTVWTRRYQQINDFERMLAENGVVIVKFFLHISRAEQRDRLIERLRDETKNWKFREGDLDDRAQWGAFTRAYRDALHLCSTPWAPWYVVPADSKHARNHLVTRILVKTLERLDLRYPRAKRSVLRLASTIE